jgi:hypothetical protein
MLLLMQLDLNGLASSSAYSEEIRKWLLVNDGTPPIPRRAITDHGAVASLR